MKAEPSFTNQGVLGILAGAMVVSGLGYFAAAPFIALYVVLATAAVGLVWAIATRDSIFRTPPVLALGAGLLLMAVTLPFVWNEPGDLLGVVIFLPLLIAPGAAALLSQDRRWMSPYAVPVLALIGVLAAFGGGLFEYVISNGTRVGMGNNPIHYAGIAVILGYVALTGVAAGRSPWRIVFLLGPLAGLGAVILSGSRGPLLAWAGAALVALPFVTAWFWRNIAFWIAIFSAAQVATIGYFMGLGWLSPRLAAAYAAITQGTGIPGVDPVRAVLYGSAWDHFLASPIFGHGATRIMAVAGPRLAEAKMARLDNLHSDVADFAVVGGSIGLLAYACFLAAPLLVLFDKRARANRALVLGCVLLPACYFGLGLTNAMFGILAQTVLYALILGLLMAQAQQLRGEAVEDRV